MMQTHCSSSLNEFNILYLKCLNFFFFSLKKTEADKIVQLFS